MEWTQVTSQAEFDAAIRAGCTSVEITKAVRITVKLPESVCVEVKAVADAILELLGKSRIQAWSTFKVEAWGSSQPHVEAWGSSQPHVEAWGSSQPHVEAWGSSQPHVEAWESSQPHVEAWGSSQPHVEAWGYVQLSLFGQFTAKLAASCHAVLRGGAKAEGGLSVTVDISTPEKWCEFYGVEIIGDHAILFKGVNETFHSAYGADYTPGTATTARDWDGGVKECGCGLHFSPCAAMTKPFNSSAVKFVACMVLLSEMAVHPNGSYPEKVKAHRCWNWYECDADGKQIGERFEIIADTSEATT